MMNTNFIQLQNNNLLSNVSNNQIQIKQQSSKEDEITYNDPLTKWPVRGLAYSNELGVAIGEIAPKAGALLWVPALMYFGADIYDKYKNQETNYNPSTQRALERATFQALASVILPTVAVHSGQKIMSFADKFSKEKLTTNAREEVLNFILDFINKSKLSDHEKDFSQYVERFNKSLKTYIADEKGQEHSRNIFSKIFKFFFSTSTKGSMSKANENALLEYANKHLKDILSIRTSLMQKERPEILSNKNYNKFIDIQKSFLKEYGKEHYLHKSAKFALREHINTNIFKLKMFKTLGGFIALGFAIKPIDSFVDTVIMKKVVEPNIDKLNNINFKSSNNKII